MLSRAQSKAIIDELKRRTPNNDVLERHLAIEQELAGSTLSVGNRVTLLQDGPITYAAMLAAIRGAKQHVHMETYIFEADETGQQFARALIERARAGVKVRLLYDAVGSNKTPAEFFKEIEAGGVEVVAFNPLGPGTVLSRGLESLNHRDHRKLTLVDGRVAFVGGINISGVYTSSRSSGSSGSSGPSGSSGTLRMSGSAIGTPAEEFDKQPWRDMQSRIEGPVVADLQRAFLSQWAKQKKESPIEDKAYFPQPPAAGPHIVRAIPGTSTDPVNAMYMALLSAVENAEKEVLIMNPYFVPHEDLRSALVEAARRGVDVKLILPSRSDSWLAYHAGRSFYEGLLEAGVKIYERKDRMMHTKTATVDGVWTTVGSTNLDWRSLLYNDEINVVVLGADFADQMNAVFRGDLAASEEITREKWHRRALEERIKEFSARAWARFL
jgi:cardiolipin synthase A/B